MYFNITHWMDESEAKDYIANVLSPNLCTKRTYSSDSDSGSPKLNPTKKLQIDNTSEPTTSMAGEENISETLHKFITQYNQDMASQRESVSNMHTKLNNLSQKMLTTDGLNKVRDELLLEISGLRKTVTELTTKYNNLKESYEKKIGDLERNLAEAKLPDKKPFDIESTVVITGLHYKHGENIKEVCQNLITNGLHLPSIEVQSAQRFGMRDGRPGIIKLEVKNLAEKLDILHAKGALKHNKVFERVFIRSSQSHEQRLLQQHTTEVLKLIGKENDFYFNGSGRLVKKSTDRNPNHSGTSDTDSLKEIKDLIKNLISAPSSQA